MASPRDLKVTMHLQLRKQGPYSFKGGRTKLCTAELMRSAISDPRGELIAKQKPFQEEKMTEPTEALEGF